MKYLAILLLAISTAAFAQVPVPPIPASDFVSKVSDGQATLGDLLNQLQIAQKQLAAVQSVNVQLHKDLSDAQAKVASCKAF